MLTPNFLLIVYPIITTLILVFISYFVIKMAVKNGMKEVLEERDRSKQHPGIN